MSQPEFECQICPAKFRRYDVLKQHIQRLHTHEEVVYDCSTCGLVFNTVLQLHNHRLTHVTESHRFRLSETALRGNVKSYEMKHHHERPITDVMKVLTNFSDEINSVIYAGIYY